MGKSAQRSAKRRAGEAVRGAGDAMSHVPAAESSPVLRLDRATQRKELVDAIVRLQRVMVALVHGEADQGHDHFARIMTWSLRAIAVGDWRTLLVKWPSPSPSLGTRLATLLQKLAHELGIGVDLPDNDPTTPAGAQAWAPALARIAAAFDMRRECLFIQHEIGWVATGTGGDDALVDEYLRAIWSRVAQRPGPAVVVCLDLQRIEHRGTPMNRSWWRSRKERAVARAVEAVLDRHHMPPGGSCVVVPELGSVSVDDLILWLRYEARRSPSAAAGDARHLLSTTRGGRFDLVARRLDALAHDRHRTIK